MNQNKELSQTLEKIHLYVKLKLIVIQKRLFLFQSYNKHIPLIFKMVKIQQK